ncbi:MAG: H-NS histone family protein [Proteobacteria bacterium]|nr:H-NS histone family protein [Pseudomonadota bacterium]
MKALKQMTSRELLALKTKVEQVIRRREEKARRDLVRMIEALRAGRRAGASVAAGEAHPLKGRKLKPKYRNPADRTQTWAGRGNQPRWLKAELKRGKKLTAFLVR